MKRGESACGPAPGFRWLAPDPSAGCPPFRVWHARPPQLVPAERHLSDLTDVSQMIVSELTASAVRAAWLRWPELSARLVTATEDRLY
jgi:hypothetical protein